MSITISPGPPGVELGYAEITANAVRTDTGTLDVPGLAVTVEVGARPIIVKLNAATLTNGSAGALGTVQIREGATQLASSQAILTTIALPVSREVRLAPAAGSHTYKVTLAQFGTGTLTLGAAATDPAFIQVLEV